MKKMSVFLTADFVDLVIGKKNVESRWQLRFPGIVVSHD